MCGIFAVLCRQSPKMLEKMLNGSKCLSKRGPDNKTTLINSSGIYVFHRLSINDTSISGNQPMISNDVLLMCNGEIYNHIELEKEFELKCHSKSDCEVILRLYEHFRKDGKTKDEAFTLTVKRLYGVFAIILVDQEHVFLARDRIGVRPLYFGVTKENDLAVASVPNALVDFCSSIRAFPPGVTAVYNKSVPFENLQILYKDEIILHSLRTSQGMMQLKEALIEAVRLRLMSDRPMGCLLSGGLDSSLIAAILVKFLGGKNVRTYSIGMEGSTDLFYARKVAEFLGTVHHEVLFTAEEGLSVIPEVIETLGSYDITTIRASVGMYLLAKYISTKTDDKVIFSGEGSDEILQGYLYFHKAPSPEEGETESLRLVNNLHLYDVLRCDRCISANGLEPRVPFLDRHVVNVTLSIPASEKCAGVDGRCEKYILRKAFEGFLPEDILWRKKEAFSDGVSSLTKSWYQYIQEMAETKISDEIFNPTAFPSKEAMYFKLIFDKVFPKYDLKMDYWLPKWCGNVKDPSARVLTIY